jgi:ABC-type transporter Mla maintaining outer membrane lipid asymmetry permease subunit MlaE
MAGKYAGRSHFVPALSRERLQERAVQRLHRAHIKTTIFGFIIGVVACFQGMRTKGGTEGVGRSATSSVVLSSLFVILADVVLVRLIQMLWG